MFVDSNNICLIPAAAISINSALWGMNKFKSEIKKQNKNPLQLTLYSGIAVTNALLSIQALNTMIHNINQSVTPVL